jgi:hypothetical protein
MRPTLESANITVKRAAVSWFQTSSRAEAAQAAQTAGDLVDRRRDIDHRLGHDRYPDELVERDPANVLHQVLLAGVEGDERSAAAQGGEKVRRVLVDADHEEALVPDSKRFAHGIERCEEIARRRAIDDGHRPAGFLLRFRVEPTGYDVAGIGLHEVGGHGQDAGFGLVSPGGQ